MAVLTDEEILELASGSKVEAVDVGEDDDIHTVVLKAPRRVSFDRFVDGPNTIASLKALVMECLLHPTPQEFKGLIDRYPMVLGNDIGQAVLRLSGSGKAKTRTLG